MSFYKIYPSKFNLRKNIYGQGLGGGAAPNWAEVGGGGDGK